jgi:alpha-amylase/alpha-mannosidase (GH57 family)
VAVQIAVHAHFYQPPRDNPWTKEIDPQPGASPFHDWNERVHAEAYKPNAFARIPAEDGEQVVNNFERLSFNVGPTLLAWMEKADPSTYAEIVAADDRSRARLGHGNAIAQAFHHTILPLSSVRDARTQVRWGLADFRHRFGREAAGMWLPETAADDDTLGVLIEEGVGFTVLAPGQAAEWRDEGGEWRSVEDDPIDPRVAYRYEHRDGSGRSLTLFFYDGDISHAIAFGDAVSSAEKFVDLFAQRGVEGAGLVHAATDGETYGHHHVFTDLGLAYALFVEAEQRGIEVTNYSAYLEREPPVRDARIKPGDGSSWSCAHGVERWRADCGCHTGGERGWNQAWRGPLRDALEVVRAAADEAFERLGTGLLADPWAARDDFVHAVIGAAEADEVVARNAGGPLDDDDRTIARTLLELQESSMSMFTSCGWFFNDVGGIETVQVLRYAARTLELLDSLGQPSPQDTFVSMLEQAESNDPDIGTGADVFRALERA